MTAKKCIVNGCDSSVKPFHCIPRTYELREKWLYNLGRSDLQELPFTTLAHRVVCGAHFKPSQYYFPGSYKLLRHTLPDSIQPFVEPCKVNTKHDAVPSIKKAVVDNIDSVSSATVATAPFLCDNKVLLKTKSTYSKHNNSTTHENDSSLPKKTETEIVSSEHLMNNKKRKRTENETSEQYDHMLITILEAEKSLPSFIDIIFGFLYRRTDFFHVSTSKEENEKLGLQNGVAQNLLWQAFRKYRKRQECVSIPEPTKFEENIEVVKQEKIEERKKIINENNDIRAVFENYSWSQSSTNLDIQIKIPDKITCKQLHIDITSSNMLVKLKDSDTVYLEGELCKKCQDNETIWSLGGQILQIHLKKSFKCWWDCLLKGEPKLDINRTNFTKKPEEHVKKFKVLNSDEINLKLTLDNDWSDKGLRINADPLKISIS